MNDQVSSVYEFGPFSLDVPPNVLQFAMVLSLLDERDEAFAWVQRAVESKRLQPYQLEYRAELDPLKNDPRFEQMLARVRNERPPVTLARIPPT